MPFLTHPSPGVTIALPSLEEMSRRRSRYLAKKRVLLMLSNFVIMCKEFGRTSWAKACVLHEHDWHFAHQDAFDTDMNPQVAHLMSACPRDDILAFSPLSVSFLIQALFELIMVFYYSIFPIFVSPPRSFCSSFISLFASNWSFVKRFLPPTLPPATIIWTITKLRVTHQEMR